MKERNPLKSITIYSVINLLTSVFFYGVWIMISLIYLIVYSFGKMGRGTSHDILAVFLMIGIVLVPTVIWKTQTKTSDFSQNKK